MFAKQETGKNGFSSFVFLSLFLSLPWSCILSLHPFELLISDCFIRFQVPECFVERHHSRHRDQGQRQAGYPDWPAEPGGDSSWWPALCRWSWCHGEDRHQVWRESHTHSLTPGSVSMGQYLLSINQHWFCVDCFCKVLFLYQLKLGEWSCSVSRNYAVIVT